MTHSTDPISSKICLDAEAKPSLHQSSSFDTLTMHWHAEKMHACHCSESLDTEMFVSQQ